MTNIPQNYIPRSFYKEYHGLAIKFGFWTKLCPLCDMPKTIYRDILSNFVFAQILLCSRRTFGSDLLGPDNPHDLAFWKKKCARFARLIKQIKTTIFKNIWKIFSRPKFCIESEFLSSKSIFKQKPENFYIAILEALSSSPTNIC